MTKNPKELTGIDATLSALEHLENIRSALPLVGSALEEDGPVRLAALRFLLARPGIEGAEQVVRRFSRLDPRERAEALQMPGRLLRAAEVVLSGGDREGRQGLATFASSLPPPEGLRFIHHLIDDPAQAVQAAAREALIRTAQEYLKGRWSVSSQADLHRFVVASELALRNTGEEQATPLVEALFRLAPESAEARSILRNLAAGDSGAAQNAVRETLATNSSAAVPAILCDLLALGSTAVNDWVLPILRRRQEPGFLLSLAREATRRMQSPRGIPASAVSALSQVAWESFPTRDLASLSSHEQKLLLSIACTFTGDLSARAQRIAVFLKSHSRRIREKTLDLLRDYPPATYKDELPVLLDDPAEEIQLRAAELLVRVGTPQSRRQLLQKSRHASDRVRRFILGRLGTVRSAGTIRESAPPAPRSQKPFEEYAFPVARSSSFTNVGDGS